jgi:hypothetical protein
MSDLSEIMPKSGRTGKNHRQSTAYKRRMTAMPTGPIPKVGDRSSGRGESKG